MGSVTPKTNMLIALAAFAAAAGTRFAAGLGGVPGREHAQTSKVGNSSRAGSNRAHQRVALKKRNQARHRKACRG